MKINITSNGYAIPPEKLFSLAARKNKKRSFLFVSKVLGKHIPSRPHVPVAVGRLLAGAYAKEAGLVEKADFEDECVRAIMEEGCELGAGFSQLPKWRRIGLGRPTLFIGFAETATALGVSAFEAFDGPAWYIHTTRKELGIEGIRFEEEHSHAPSHILYTDGIPLEDIKDVVFVDDELTTGKTALNMIKSLSGRMNAESFTVLTILDWRKKSDREGFQSLAAEKGIDINVIGILEGCIEVDDVKWRMNQDAARIKNDSLKCGGEHALMHDKDEWPGSAQIEMESVSLCHFFKTCSVGLGKEAALEGTGRFGLDGDRSQGIFGSVERSCELLKRNIGNGKTLFLGSGEFMAIPMKMGCHLQSLGFDIWYHSTTRSPIYPSEAKGYAVGSAVAFKDPEHPEIENFAYNIEDKGYERMFVFTERKPTEEGMRQLQKIAMKAGVERAFAVYFSGELDRLGPAQMGSYNRDEVKFLLKRIGDQVQEQTDGYREAAVQSGVHYSEMLPVEYSPSDEYMRLFESSLAKSCERVAEYVAKAARRIMREKGRNAVLVSLARAGTPTGILMKRYISQACGVDLPHYSISIIRGKGLDVNAIKYISQRHDTKSIQFIDGWTGKGAIKKELQRSCMELWDRLAIRVSPSLAVIADPGSFSEISGTSEDFLIPSACLNSTVSGLISRTFHRGDITGEGDFHAAKFYSELMEDDVSQLFIDSVSRHFEKLQGREGKAKANIQPDSGSAGCTGAMDVEAVMKDFGIDDVNLVKPGVGETTRVLLRRIPWKVLISTESSDADIAHILQLAAEKNVQVLRYPLKCYKCCGLIKKIRGGDI